MRVTVVGSTASVGWSGAPTASPTRVPGVDVPMRSGDHSDSGKRRKPVHRAIIYSGVIGGLTNRRIDELLDAVDERPLPPRSYASIRDHYVPYFKVDVNRVGAAIEHPPTWSALKKAGQRDLPHDAHDDDDPADDE